jgi:hypothetical protein
MIRATEVDREEGSDRETGGVGYPVEALLTGAAWDPCDREAIDNDQYGTSR